jgi:acyl dehydratase
MTGPAAPETGRAATSGMPPVLGSVVSGLVRSAPRAATALASRIVGRAPAVPDPVLPVTELARVGVRLESTRVAAYARVCGFGLRDEIPLTYPYVASFPLQVALLTSPEFPFPALGTVHLANTFTWERRIGVGEPLDIAVRAEHLAPHRRGHQFEVVTVVQSAGETVWTSRSTYLARGAGHLEAGREAAPEVELRPMPIAWRIAASQGREYAAVSGDYNPIHLSDLSARALGLPGAIAHGMWSYARVIAHLGPRVPARGTSTVWFRDPIRLPSTVRLGRSSDDVAIGVLPASGDRTHLVATVTEG